MTISQADSREVFCAAPVGEPVEEFACGGRMFRVIQPVHGRVRGGTPKFHRS